jgi:hypothetical protein
MRRMRETSLGSCIVARSTLSRVRTSSRGGEMALCGRSKHADRVGCSMRVSSRPHAVTLAIRRTAMKAWVGCGDGTAQHTTSPHRRRAEPGRSHLAHDGGSPGSAQDPPHVERSLRRHHQAGTMHLRTRHGGCDNTAAARSTAPSAVSTNLNALRPLQAALLRPQVRPNERSQLRAAHEGLIATIDVNEAASNLRSS